MIMFFKLLIAHAVGDFAIRTEAMSKGKSRHYVDSSLVLPPGQEPVPVWFYYLTAHALVNCGMVWVVTGNVQCAVAEFILHLFIDFWKCEGMFTPHVDQFLHILCKVVYAIILGGVI